MERGRVLRGRTHGPDSGVQRMVRGREEEGFGLGGCGVLRERPGGDGCGCALREQHADVAAAEGEVSGTQAAGIRCAQGREQKEEAGEMAVAQTHVLSMLNEMRGEWRVDCGFGVGGFEVGDEVAQKLTL